MAPDCRAAVVQPQRMLSWGPVVSAPLLALDVDQYVLRNYGMTLGIQSILSLDIKF